MSQLAMSSPATLVNLPRELQVMIMQRALPCDFESLILTCKQLHAVALPVLSRHNALRRKYRRFHFTDSYHHREKEDITETVTQLLLDIAADPFIAHHIVHGDFSDRVCTDGIRQSSENYRGAVLQRLEKEQDNLKALVQGSLHLAMLGLDTGVWFDNIVADRDQYDEQVDYPLAFLLSLLPNLESLTLPGEWRPASVFTQPDDWEPVDDIQKGVQDLINLLVTRANDTENVMGDQPLRKLHSLHPTKNVDTQFGTNISSIAPFLALDSLREVHHDSGVCDLVEHKPKKKNNGGLSVAILDFQARGRYQVLGRNLETAVFEDVVISGEACEPLFRDMHNLKVLDVEYNMKDEIGYDWEPETFLSGLMSLGKTLKSLSLTANNLGPDHGRIFYPEGDLKGLQPFEVLTYLKLDTKLFIHSRAVVDNFDAEPTDEDDIETPSLIDIAPRNLRTFVLHVPATQEDYVVMECLFVDLGDRRNELPDLNTIKVVIERQDVWGDDIEGWSEHAEKIKAFCAAKDIKVTML
ncbi:unnamed protein product [Clonostachys solani]|uniref:F-box domain-containing protein n=1 Tax=Clonostachys solani TaxID=160281 RepID=A0A9P0ERJ0_9HYPO|nr:unnamed protein product [Clonostachys solani]